MTHVVAPTISSNHPSLPNQPFFAWLRSQTALFVGQMLMLLGTVYSIVALVFYSSELHVPTGIITPKTNWLVEHHKQWLHAGVKITFVASQLFDSDMYSPYPVVPFTAGLH